MFSRSVKLQAGSDSGGWPELSPPHVTILVETLILGWWISQSYSVDLLSHDVNSQIECLGRPVNPLRPMVDAAQVWPWVRSWSQAGTFFLSGENPWKSEPGKDRRTWHGYHGKIERKICTVYLHAQHPRHVRLHFVVETGQQQKVTRRFAPAHSKSFSCFFHRFVGKNATMSLPPGYPWHPLARNFLWHAISLCHTDWHRLDGMRKAD